MKKRCLTIFLALALVLTVLPAGAWAARQSASVGEMRLTGTDLLLYRQLKEKITMVANGVLNSSEFVLDATGLGITCRSGQLDNVSFSTIIDALLADCPYELYWYDKEEGVGCAYAYTTPSYCVTSLTFQFSVYQDYAATNDAEQIYYLYRPDTAKTSAAAAVARSAQAVVDRYSGLSDYEKLEAYQDYICGQVSYDTQAAASSDYPYGGPWQLIYVFDGDPNTNVVCEGYTKAFKYLCDLSTFSNAVECYIVASESHMWNVVRINGESYLADITNSDEGMAGQQGGLFLAGTPNSTRNGCTIHIPKLDLGNGYYREAVDKDYQYDEGTRSLYDESFLILAPSDFLPTAAGSPASAGFPQATPPMDVTATPTASAVLVNGANVAFDAYNIDGANYFKLRDLAFVLSGTEKQFEVSWDGAANAISLISGQPYTAVGGEMAPGIAAARTATPTSSKILLNGAEVVLEAYNIGGNNYFKLRDLGSAFDFGVDWDGAANTVVIDTSKGYTPD